MFTTAVPKPEATAPTGPGDRRGMAGAASGGSSEAAASLARRTGVQHDHAPTVGETGIETRSSQAAPDAPVMARGRHAGPGTLGRPGVVKHEVDRADDAASDTDRAHRSCGRCLRSSRDAAHPDSPSTPAAEATSAQTSAATGAANTPRAGRSSSRPAPGRHAASTPDDEYGRAAAVPRGPDSGAALHPGIPAAVTDARSTTCAPALLLGHERTTLVLFLSEPPSARLRNRVNSRSRRRGDRGSGRSGASRRLARQAKAIIGERRDRIGRNGGACCPIRNQRWDGTPMASAKPAREALDGYVEFRIAAFRLIFRLCGLRCQWERFACSTGHRAGSRASAGGGLHRLYPVDGCPICSIER